MISYSKGTWHLVITPLVSYTQGTRHLVTTPLVSYTKGTCHLVITSLISYCYLCQCLVELTTLAIQIEYKLLQQLLKLPL
jgi:hypothetical protein